MFLKAAFFDERAWLREGKVYKAAGTWLVGALPALFRTLGQPRSAITTMTARITAAAISLFIFLTFPSHFLGLDTGHLQKLFILRRYMFVQALNNDC